MKFNFDIDLKNETVHFLGSGESKNGTYHFKFRQDETGEWQWWTGRTWMKIFGTTERDQEMLRDFEELIDQLQTEAS